MVPSLVSGGNVNITARGAGADSTIDVTGSVVEATNNVTFDSEGAVTFRSATETDIGTGSSKSSGFQAGAAIGLSLSKDDQDKNSQDKSPASARAFASFNSSSSSYDSEDISHIETVVRAGGTATVSTQEAFTMDGARVEADRVVVDAKTLEITSPQDSSTFTSDARSTGVNVGYDFADKTLSVGGSYSKTDIDGDFVSVNEQSGIFAGEGGFDINIEEKATLNGAVVASEASPDLNSFRSAELEMNDLANRETFDASQMNVSASLSGGINSLGKATTGQDRLPGTQRPGLNAGLPTFFTAGDEQSGTTYSAIANGTIIIGGEDRSDDPGINNDTDGANDGALDQAFTDETRKEINDSFAAARILAAEGNTFFVNRAREEAEKKEEAEQAEANAKAAGAVVDEETGKLTAPEGSLAAAFIADAELARADAARIHDTFGAGSMARLVATALNGAAGGDVTNGLNGLAQSAAVNVLQGLGAQQIKRLADGLGKKTTTKDEQGRDVTTFEPTTESELLRGVLQGIAGCAAGAAGGSGDCGSAAMGASASVAISLLINSLEKNKDTAVRDAQGNLVNVDSEDDLEHSRNVTTIVGFIAEAVGLDSNAASVAGQTETENNDLFVNGRWVGSKAANITQEEADALWDNYFAQGEGKLILEAADNDRKLVRNCLGSSPGSGCAAVQEKLNALRLEARRDDLLKREAAFGLSQEEEERIRNASPEELAAIEQNVAFKEYDQQLIQTLAASDDLQDQRVAELLLGTSEEVRRAIYAQTKEAAGEGEGNVLSDLAATAFGEVVGADNALRLLIIREEARIAGEAGMDASRSAITTTADTARKLANDAAQEALDRGVSPELVEAARLEAFEEIAAEEEFALAALDTAGGIGTIVYDPGEAAVNAARSAAGVVDAVLNDRRTPMEIATDLFEAGSAEYEAYLALSPEEQATFRGKLRGRASFEIAATVATGGAASVATRAALRSAAKETINGRDRGSGGSGRGSANNDTGGGTPHRNNDANNPPNGQTDAPDTDADTGPSTSKDGPSQRVDGEGGSSGSGVPVGDSYVPSGPAIVKDSTVELNQNIVTKGGEVIPAGSIVTESGGAIKAITPDGTQIVGKTDDLLGANQLALQAPRFDEIALEGQKRQGELLDADEGYNVSGAKDEINHSDGTLGNPNPGEGPVGGATFLTDKKAFEDILGGLPEGGGTIKVTREQLNQLEDSLGLRAGSLDSGSVLRQIKGVKSLIRKLLNNTSHL
ncbi:hemagglutinin repeat-containing protein [Alterisphingorhabdus coralli]|uniref:Hemagglutinin repeat-containing protein n=1 Tax=Alterisphingorhabdus coralli TaxID=3071408 RepID=A0AA97F4U3_9SPHN|nr:hemagglutinin repeat-containing protein [Parasphingorhabdus sp. SCSIO 66989]WOE74041.1 hemagglutinin repeat-containing protein [Parasphingorhabdus sp. SCSIO 66989]